MIQVDWTGRCEADRATTGIYEVPTGTSTAMYGLVFDNTHSKQWSKIVTFVLMTYPSNMPPKSGHQLHFSSGAQPILKKQPSSISGRTNKLKPTNGFEMSSTHEASQSIGVKIDLATPESPATGMVDFLNASCFSGTLFKKRRKRNQGYARRLFSLDFTSSTLSYHKNRNSSALRGAVPLSLAVIGADTASRHISIDTGTEVWLLKAPNQKDFDAWRSALERASKSTSRLLTSIEQGDHRSSLPQDPLDDRDWSVAETLVGRVSGITDAVRRLAKDTDPKYKSGSSSAASPRLNDGTGSGDYFPDQSRLPERTSFWRRKSTSTIRSSTMLAAMSPPAGPSAMALAMQRKLATDSGDNHMHEHCMSLLRDLDAVVADFSELLAQNRQRRGDPGRVSLGLQQRKSVDSSISQEFFDAEEGAHASGQLLALHQDSGGTDVPDDETTSMGDSNSESDIDGEEIFEPPQHSRTPSITRGISKKLTPLPRAHVIRRTLIPPSSGPPPSIISFLRKNVGKDLSTIAMPVTSNEPLSLLQRTAEQMEYSELLDAAASASSESSEKLCYVTAFAISTLSNTRIKERALRKPFNPMLGETYELVREDKGFRFLAEKISHRPVRIACQADAKNWTFTHAPMPSQKFWGKSVELITEGRARVVLSSTGDCYSWKPATCFLRNLIAGEKYVEPVETMTVVNEITGLKAVVSFKAGGMFSGRSEDVAVTVLDAQGTALPLGVHGKWTSRFILQGGASHGKEIWTAGPTVDAAATRYGMTLFSSQLNEITAMERDALPPTDSRLRPDQRAYEDGSCDEAESLKIQLEESQRRRRKVMDAQGEEWTPQWFVPDDDDPELWTAKELGGYWETRAAGTWAGVQKVFEL